MYAPDSAVLATPIGMVRISGDDRVLWAIAIEAEGQPQSARGAILKTATKQIAQWFAGTRRCFDLPLAPLRTARGEQLRQAMIAIPYGEVESYGAFARRVASSPRAIGQVCARNPFPIVVPCHRVVAAIGLGHYSGGDGVSTKQWLLDHEQRYRRHS